MHLLLVLYLTAGITGKIQGAVFDAVSGDSLSNVNVVILNTPIGAATDDHGNFFILNVPAGRYTLEVSCIGYQTQRLKDIIVEIDQTVRLKIFLEESLIEIEPVIIIGESPIVKKDYVNTTYIIRKSELNILPIDYSNEWVAFQPAVAHTDTALHVRGGRVTEVAYMIDNVSIIDPQTGDPAISVSKGIIDEVIFMAGGFDAEYGRAMSGVVNLITTYPLEKLQMKSSAKTETVMPFYYDFGYQNYQSLIHIPLHKKFRGLCSFDIMHTDDWDPRLFILPHKQRDDYAIYSKWLFSPSGKFNFFISGTASRIQFDRYPSNTQLCWKFYLDHYRSDLRKSNLVTLNLNYLPDSRKFFNLTLSRLFTKRTYGVREMQDYNFLTDYKMRYYKELEWPEHGNNNTPYGVGYYSIICKGDYPEYEDKSSEVRKANINLNTQVHKYHELKAGGEYSRPILKNFHYFVGDSLHPLADDYLHTPCEYSVFVQDNIDYEGLYLKVGGRFDGFLNDMKSIKPYFIFTPRLGASFLVTEKFLFRANWGRYIQQPLYDYLYDYYDLLPLPTYCQPPSYSQYILVGNPSLRPEQTISYEIGLQGEVRKNLLATINAYYKDVTDLIGTRFVTALPTSYFSYFNVEYANLKGIETIIDMKTQLFKIRTSYTLSWARGSSSYATEIYSRFQQQSPDTTTLPVSDYYLDFDQRHRIFFQGEFEMLKIACNLFGYLGIGFPYTPPGPEGKYEERNIMHLPFQKRIDCVFSRSFKKNTNVFTFSLEIINLLNQIYQITPHRSIILLNRITHDQFKDYISITDGYYQPAADINHDGVINPMEEFLSFRGLAIASDDWVHAYSSPRRARISVTIGF
jgi:hypothetical protein